MPSVVCTICSECLELDHQVVSACPCGHVYHETCLSRWLPTSATCPICREKATKRNLVKLFFEATDENDPSQDPAKLKNALDEIQLKVTSLTKEKGELHSESERLSSLVDSLNGRVRNMTKQFKQEQMINDGFRRQLSLMNQENEQAKECKKETKKLRAKVKQLERFERIMTENTEAVEDMIKERGEYTQASMELATYCIAIKHEFEAIKLSRRSLREDIDKLRKDNSAKTRQLIDTRRDQDHLLKTNQSLKDEVQSLIEEKQRMQAKMKALEKTMNASPSVLHATPKLNRPSSGEVLIDGEDTPIHDPGCPDTPELMRDGPSTQVKKTCDEFDISYVKTTSKSKKAVIKSEDRIALQSLANSSLFAHSRMGKPSAGKIVKGFDGLGGHRSFIRTEAMKRALPPSMQLAVKKRKKVKGNLPAYPTMDSFLT
ncbi:E3 ubiquitin-protein ligase TRAIP-like isoform X1 [Apostichopus japonicus]|uniref:E3 ubiquitin-protein ligase TRAIP-like isoform X1 n=1 Tax=Stichopus japonicus TaxID=307972 RepID=UPI003AB55DB5